MSVGPQWERKREEAGAIFWQRPQPNNGEMSFVCSPTTFPAKASWLLPAPPVGDARKHLSPFAQYAGASPLLSTLHSDALLPQGRPSTPSPTSTPPARRCSIRTYNKALARFAGPSTTGNGPTLVAGGGWGGGKGREEDRHASEA